MSLQGSLRQVDFSLKFCQFNKIVLKDITSITIATNKKPLGNAGNRHFIRHWVPHLRYHNEKVAITRLDISTMTDVTPNVTLQMGKSKKVLDTTKMSSNEIFQAILKADGQL